MDATSAVRSAAAPSTLSTLGDCATATAEDTTSMAACTASMTTVALYTC